MHLLWRMSVGCYTQPARGESTEGTPMTDDDKAREIAHGLIQGYIGPDHKVIDMKAFFSALVQALKRERVTGREESPSI